LVRSDRISGHDDLVAGRENADTRLAMHEQPWPVHRREEPDVARGEPPPGPQQHLAFAEVEAFAADITAARRAFEHADAVAVALCVLLDDNRIGTRRQWCTGEDAGGFARLDTPAETGSGRHFGDDAQLHRHGLDV